MNKLTKIGVTALCGSLAAITSANAGSMSVAGGATATWAALDGVSSGNNIGLNSGLTFTGTGELDNGTTFTLTVTQADKTTYSSSNLVLTIPGFGAVGIDQGAGGQGIDRLDDKMPTAWEETNGTAVTTGLQTIAGVGGSTNIEWAVSSDILPEGLSAYLAWSPKADGSSNNDKGVSGVGADIGQGWDVVLEHSGLMDGLNVFAGASTIEQGAWVGGLNATTSDRTQYAWGLTYAQGSVTVGYQETRDNLQLGTDASTSHYDNTAYGVSFAVNDDLSISYGVHDSDKVTTDGGKVYSNSADSIQVAYSMGGASIKIAETSVDGGNYDSTTATDNDGTTIALTLAF